MLAIVVGLGAVMYGVSGGAINGFSENYAAGMQGQSSGLAEKFAVEQVTFSFSGTTGADVFVRNAASIPTTIVAVYVTDTTSNTFVTQATMSTTINVGTFADITPAKVSFTPLHGHSYQFEVTSSLGNSVVQNALAN